jgi:hypothetical protein
MSTVEKETATKCVEVIKLIFPKYALKFIKQSYRNHPPTRFFTAYFHRFARKTHLLIEDISFKYCFRFLMFDEVFVSNWES